MTLLMQENFDVTESSEISLVGQLSELQWQALLPQIYARLVLRKENQQAIAKTGAEIPFYELAHLSKGETGQFFFP
jgi:hypothetical protein